MLANNAIFSHGAFESCMFPLGKENSEMQQGVKKANCAPVLSCGLNFRVFGSLKDVKFLCTDFQPAFYLCCRNCK